MNKVKFNKKNFIVFKKKRIFDIKILKKSRLFKTLNDLFINRLTFSKNNILFEIYFFEWK